ncbi:uncharacterized protein LOC111355713 [Spodoptera litura]|uniref:Uncharacterized protein LOC111355713 n=1 Tax=Spodoptera litura TaxID=69820 RepID=A0A9J7E936_SPOLT|nr:uncharacterized protein LOC111355713 [Spodoptera litura]
MVEEQRLKWPCQECRSRAPKVGNLNTPVRNLKEDDIIRTEERESVLGNITLRRKQSVCNKNSKNQVSAGSPKTKDDSLVSAISEQVHDVILSELPGIISNIMKTELSSIKEDLSDFRRTIEFVSAGFDEMRNTVNKLAKENSDLSVENKILKSNVSELLDRLNNVEQHLREENLEIQGVPEHRNESLPNLLEQCGRVVGCSFDKDDIVKCTRVAKLNRESKLPRAIIVKFGNARKRDEFYSAVYRYNKSNPKEKLNTSLLGIGGVRKPVYVSEHLSLANRKLHAAARQRAKELGYKFVWIKNGRIYVRKLEDSKYIIVRNTDSLDLIC